jgi:hypothetical protein
VPLLLRQVNTDKLPQLSTIAVFIESGQGEQFSLPRQSCCVGDEIIRTIACWDKFSAEQSGMRIKRRPKLDAAWRGPDRVEAPLAVFQRYKRAATLAREFPITLVPFHLPPLWPPVASVRLAPPNDHTSAHTTVSLATRLLLERACCLHSL